MTVIGVPPNHQDFHRMLVSGRALFNTVDIGLLAGSVNGRFEVLSVRMTLGYATAHAAPIVFEDDEWFAARIQQPAASFDALVTDLYRGAALRIEGVPHPCYFSPTPTSWFVNHVSRYSDGVWGAPSVRYPVGSSWGRIFADYNAYQEWISRLNGRRDIHDLRELVQRIGLRQECGQYDHTRQAHLELELPIYLAAHEVSDHDTTVVFRTQVPASSWQVKWRSDASNGIVSLEDTSQGPTMKLAGVHESLELSPLFSDFSFGVGIHTRAQRPPKPTKQTVSRPIASPGRVTFLFLSANPDRGHPLDVEREQARIKTTASASKHQDHIDIAALPDLDLVQLAKAMRLHSPRGLHFAGHGGPGGTLLMRDHNGAPMEMTAGGIARLIRQHRDVLRLVVLNACYTEGLAELVVEEIGCVIGMTTEVLDDAAILFAQTLYGALFDGTSVAHAFESAAAAVEACYGEETHKLKLLVRDGVDAAQLFLVDPITHRT